MKTMNPNIIMQHTTRVIIALLFLISWIMIISMIWPDAFAENIQKRLWLPSTIAFITTYLVIITEIGGWILVILGKLVPKLLYKLSISVFILILLIALIWVQPKVMVDIGMPVPLFTVYIYAHVSIISMLWYFLSVEPKCIFWITGESK